ncbi:transposase [Streptomyces sp. NPDC101237]|uniref:IS110 family transposase n=1 Tax=Streptomyces sp. NPDC101237 TaxID=3366139 RepID=UPI0037F1DA10
MTCTNGRTWEDRLTVFCGIDWAERHHDAAVVDEAGTLLAKVRIADDVAGYHKLLDLLAEDGGSPDDPIPVAIETSLGLLVASLRTGSRRIFAINPLAAARYRDRHGVTASRKNSELAQAITVLARAQQDAVWTRQQVANQVRSPPREYYPAALLAFQSKQGGLTRADARVSLTLAPTPAKAGKLTLAQLGAALKRSDRRFVGRRFVKNNRLINAGFLWAFAALTASPGANAHYRRRREHGDWYAAAQRHLLNRFLGQLHHCLKTRQHFDEQQAFASFLPAPA